MFSGHSSIKAEKATHAKITITVQSVNFSFTPDKFQSFGDYEPTPILSQRRENIVDVNATFEYHLASLREWKNSNDTSYWNWRKDNPGVRLRELAHEYTNNDIERFKAFYRGLWHFGVAHVNIFLCVDIDGILFPVSHAACMTGIASDCGQQFIFQTASELLDEAKEEILHIYDRYAGVREELDRITPQDIKYLS